MEQTVVESEIVDFESFLESLEIPVSCQLGKPIYKKAFLDSGVLDAEDRTTLKDDVEKVRWLYTLKPSTINIAPYNDEDREYPEVAILHVSLTSNKRLKRIAHFINRSIPYPLIILFTVLDEGGESLSVSLADKRNSQSDKDKWVIEDSLDSPLIGLSSESRSLIQGEFLSSLKFSNLPYTNFYSFYKAMINRVVAINCSGLTNEFTLESEVGKSGGVDRLTVLKEIESLEAEKSVITNRLKKEKQIGKQIELNTKVKKIDDKVAILKGSL